MLNILKFVKGSTVKDSCIPEMSHFTIKNGFISGYNGKLTISSPIPINFDCNPNAVQLFNAISRCKEDEVFSMTLNANGSVTIKSGKFKVVVDCLPTSDLKSTPEGKAIEINNRERILDCFKAMRPFISTDASRPWSTSLLIRGESAYATNNIALLEYWTGTNFGQDICIPLETVKEVCRINEVPEVIRVTESSITFGYSNYRWLKSQLYSNQWPDVYGMLSVVTTNQKVLTSDFYEGLETLKPFIDHLQRIYIGKDKISTKRNFDDGASYELHGIDGHDSIFQLEALYALKNVIKTMDFSLYPKPCVFYGENIRGVLIGMTNINNQG